MIQTIKEAGEKICPFMSRPIHNPEYESIEFFRIYCETERCMAWECCVDDRPVDGDTQGRCKLIALDGFP